MRQYRRRICRAEKRRRLVAKTKHKLAKLMRRTQTISDLLTRDMPQDRIDLISEVAARLYIIPFDKLTGGACSP